MHVECVAYILSLAFFYKGVIASQYHKCDTCIYVFFACGVCVFPRATSARVERTRFERDKGSSTLLFSMWQYAPVRYARGRASVDSLIKNTVCISGRIAPLRVKVHFVTMSKVGAR